MDRAKPARAGMRAPIRSYRPPAITDTMQFTTPPGSMSMPAMATGSSMPLWMYCGSRYMADSVMPKFSITSATPTR